MKKSIFIILGISLLLTACNSLTGIEKEKTEDGFIKSHDLVSDTIRYEHPALVPAFDVGKFNLYGNKQFENIQAYIYEDQFYLEADYGNKSRNALNIDTIMFFTTRNMIEFKNQQIGLPNTYYTFKDIDGLTYENLKVTLSEEDMTLLGRFLIADEVYVAFKGERGRTDLFKVSKKIKRSMLAVLNKWNKLNDKPIIEEPKPEPVETPVENKEEKTDEAVADKEITDKSDNITEENNTVDETNAPSSEVQTTDDKE